MAKQRFADVLLLRWTIKSSRLRGGKPSPGSWRVAGLCVIVVFGPQELSGPRLERARGPTEPPAVRRLHHRGGRHLHQLGQQQTSGEGARHPHVSNPARSGREHLNPSH